MTAQASERLIMDNRPHELFADPLYRLVTHYRLKLGNPDLFDTSNYRGYVGTWEIRDGRLYLVHLCWNGFDIGCREMPIPGEVRQRLLRAAAAQDFPIHAHWYSGVLRIRLGRQLVYSHHGWSSWYERERVVRVRAGRVVREREVDTRAILEWWLKRHPETADLLDPSKPHTLPGPLTWFDDDDGAWLDDWWPPDYVRDR